jgi:hypothetical protein
MKEEPQDDLMQSILLVSRQSDEKIDKLNQSP